MMTITGKEWKGLLYFLQEFIFTIWRSEMRFIIDGVKTVARSPEKTAVVVGTVTAATVVIATNVFKDPLSWVMSLAADIANNPIAVGFAVVIVSQALGFNVAAGTTAIVESVGNCSTTIADERKGEVNILNGNIFTNDDGNEATHVFLTPLKMGLLSTIPVILAFGVAEVFTDARSAFASFFKWISENPQAAKGFSVVIFSAMTAQLAAVVNGASHLSSRCGTVMLWDTDKPAFESCIKRTQRGGAPTDSDTDHTESLKFNPTSTTN